MPFRDDDLASQYSSTSSYATTKNSAGGLTTHDINSRNVERFLTNYDSAAIKYSQSPHLLTKKVSPPLPNNTDTRQLQDTAGIHKNDIQVLLEAEKLSSHKNLSASCDTQSVHSSTSKTSIVSKHSQASAAVSNSSSWYHPSNINENRRKNHYITSSSAIGAMYLDNQRSHMEGNYVLFPDSMPYKGSLPSHSSRNSQSDTQSLHSSSSQMSSTSTTSSKKEFLQTFYDLYNAKNMVRGSHTSSATMRSTGSLVGSTKDSENQRKPIKRRESRGSRGTSQSGSQKQKCEGLDASAKAYMYNKEFASLSGEKKKGGVRMNTLPTIREIEENDRYHRKIPQPFTVPTYQYPMPTSVAEAPPVIFQDPMPLKAGLEVGRKTNKIFKKNNVMTKEMEKSIAHNNGENIKKFTLHIR